MHAAGPKKRPPIDLAPVILSLVPRTARKEHFTSPDLSASPSAYRKRCCLVFFDKWMHLACLVDREKPRRIFCNAGTLRGPAAESRLSMLLFSLSVFSAPKFLAHPCFLPIWAEAID
ncbi:hypothetical protein M8818_002004 [Zalaria obscura]|uniref:Uncharacterized protein n=1 Tax=Zalaria obscura TaxID=2024903 RepID=A0ACC3SLX3_9PEZI